LQEEGRLSSGRRSLAGFASAREPPGNTILFIPLSGNYCNPAFDWAAACAEQIIRLCPKCLCDTIIGHGRREPQAPFRPTSLLFTTPSTLPGIFCSCFAVNCTMTGHAANSDASPSGFLTSVTNSTPSPPPKNERTLAGQCAGI